MIFQTQPEAMITLGGKIPPVSPEGRSVGFHRDDTAAQLLQAKDKEGRIASINLAPTNTNMGCSACIDNFFNKYGQSTCRCYRPHSKRY